jgi:ABC-type sugar transport system ATPase subunit
MDDRVQIRNMTKSFAGVTVLRDVNLDIVQGEVHGLVGENGSGKSTFVKIIAGLYAPDEGSAARSGASRSGSRSCRRSSAVRDHPPRPGPQ